MVSLNTVVARIQELIDFYQIIFYDYLEPNTGVLKSIDKNLIEINKNLVILQGYFYIFLVFFGFVIIIYLLYKVLSRFI